MLLEYQKGPTINHQRKPHQANNFPYQNLSSLSLMERSERSEEKSSEQQHRINKNSKNKSIIYHDHNASKARAKDANDNAEKDRVSSYRQRSSRGLSYKVDRKNRDEDHNNGEDQRRNSVLLSKTRKGSHDHLKIQDHNLSGKMSSDYYTHEEMLELKNPKKQTSLRKIEKLNIDALEAEAISAGLTEKQPKSEAEKRSNAYQLADEASKALRLEQTVTVKQDEDVDLVFTADADDDDIYKSLERARNVVLRKKNKESATGPQAIALLLATTSASCQTAEGQNTASGEPQENKVVFTEMEEFVWGLQLNKEDHKTDNEDVFVEETYTTQASDQKVKDEAGGSKEVKDEEIVMDVTMHEVPVGKGLSGALKLLKERGTLKEPVEWGGRNRDREKSKLVGTNEDDGQKEIRIERTDEFGRIMTPKEEFRMISHKFHGKRPGKMKQEKRMKQYQEELKLKQMKN